MNNLPRSTALKIAAVISFLMSAFSVFAALPMLMEGAAATENNPESLPFVVVLIGAFTGVIGMVAAYGAWKQQRWGIILTILVNLLNGLSAAPGILFAPTPLLFAAATATVILSIVIVVLCLWRDHQVVTA
jgi:hypothetical protein